MPNQGDKSKQKSENIVYVLAPRKSNGIKQRFIVVGRLMNE